MAPSSSQQNFYRYDARGLRCPIPVIRLEAILRGAAAGQIIEIIADDPVAVIDIPHFCQNAGHTVERMPDLAGACVFRVTYCGKTS